MDEETLKALRGCAEFVDGGAGDVRVQCIYLRELLDAYEALQRIAELPGKWREQADELEADNGLFDKIHASGMRYDADELQQALPEGMRT